MKSILFLSMVATFTLGNEYTYKISHISSEIKMRMIKGNSWRKGCPVSLDNLRYITLNYFDFKGKTQEGELIVHKDVAEDITQIFESLYYFKYPIKSMKLVSDFKGNDYKSIESDNTSAFNCRPVTGNKKKWSNHAYGKAIDINPIENPYINRKGTCSHSKSAKFLPKKRVHKNLQDSKDRAVLLKTDKEVTLFKDYGWKWGGDWRTIKDFQHFYKN
jgi:poly-gamma-glutamate synthesis protein (capsule biosynthesis protein)